MKSMKRHSLQSISNVYNCMFMKMCFENKLNLPDVAMLNRCGEDSLSSFISSNQKHMVIDSREGSPV